MKRLALLCGAGISIPVGMPKTQDITALVLSGKNVARHTDTTYCFHEAGDEDEFSAIDRDSPARVCAFLDILKRECDRFYCRDKSDLFGKHTTNYEDLYYLAVQIRDSDTHEFENPGIQPFIDKLLAMNEVERILAQGCHNEWDFGELHSETCGYIRGVVSSQLSRKPKGLDRLNAICDACQERGSDGVDVYTLNHDRVLEEAFEASGVDYTDGFSKPVNQVRYWDPGLLDDPGKPVRIHKLHGAVDWYWFSSGSSVGRLGIATGPDLYHTNSPEGELQRPGPFPEMLIGTFNKLMSYSAGLYSELHCRFFSRLNEVDRLAIAGYGFGDKGINERLLTWVAQPGNKAVVIEPCPDTLNLYARGAVRRHWKDFRDAGRLIHIEKGIEKTTWNEIRGHLDFSTTSF